MNIKKVLILLLLSISSNMFANDEGNGLVQDNIVVVGTKTKHSIFNAPGTASVIDMQSLENTFADNLQSIFKNESGVKVTGVRKNGQDITMRGYKSDSIAFYLDNVPQNFFSAHDGMLFLDPSLLKEVQVAYGSSSSLYGSGGLGGTILFKTKDAKDLLKQGQKHGASMGLSYSSVNNEYIASSSIYGVTDRQDYLLSVSYTQSGDIKLGDGSTLQSEDKIASVLAKTSYYVNDNNSLKVNFNYYNNDASEPNNPNEVQIEGGQVMVSDEPLDKYTTNYNGSLVHSFSNNSHNVNTGVYYQGINLNENININDPIVDKSPNPSNPTSGNIAGDKLNRDFSSFGLFSNANSSFNALGLQNVLAYGFNLRTESQESSHSRHRTINGVPNAEASYYDGYAQTESSLNTKFGKFTALAGINYSMYDSDNKASLDNSDDAWSPKFGVSYNNDYLTLFTNYLYGFRAPKMTELYATGEHYSYSIPAGPMTITGVNNFIENPNLKPETNKTFEAGAGLKFNLAGSFSIKASYFNTDSENFIDRVVVDDGPAPFGLEDDYTQFVNVASAKIEGVDLYTSYEIKNISLALNYSYADGKNTTDPLEVTPLESTNPSTFVLNVSYKVTNYAELAWRSTYAKSYISSPTSLGSSDEKVMQSYDVHDIYLGFKIKESMFINLGVENIFDENYQVLTSYYTQEGRSYKASFNYKF